MSGPYLQSKAIIIVTLPLVVQEHRMRNDLICSVAVSHSMQVVCYCIRIVYCNADNFNGKWELTYFNLTYNFLYQYNIAHFLILWRRIGRYQFKIG